MSGLKYVILWLDSNRFRKCRWLFLWSHLLSVVSWFCLLKRLFRQNASADEEILLALSDCERIAFAIDMAHYRNLLKVCDENARNWYIVESIKSHWSSRQLERQVNTHNYERLLLSREKEGVIAEANEKMSKLTPEQFIKDQYVLEFLDLNSYPELRNRSLNRLWSTICRIFCLNSDEVFALLQDKSWCALTITIFISTLIFIIAFSNAMCLSI